MDIAKPLQMVRDVNELYKKEENSALNWVKEDIKGDAKSNLEAEIKKIGDLFEKKKTIVIPSENGEGKFSTHQISYKQTEFVRPKNYIVYSEKNRLEPKGKDYEITSGDINWLTFENNPINEAELEKIISALENDINKGEMIPNERVREIILSIIPEKKQYVDRIQKVSDPSIILYYFPTQ